MRRAENTSTSNMCTNNAHSTCWNGEYHLKLYFSLSLSLFVKNEFSGVFFYPFAVVFVLKIFCVSRAK